MAKEKQKGFEGVKVTLPKFRLNFPALFEPKQYEQNGKPKGDPQFSLVACWPKASLKDGTLKKVKAAIHQACVNAWGEEESEWPEIKKPWKNGDEMSDYNGFEGMVFVQPHTSEKMGRPGIVDQKLQEVIDPSEIYAGCFCLATVTVKAFDISKDNKGVTMYLQNVQKAGDGPRLDGRPKAEDEFDEIESDEDDTENYDDSDDIGL